MSKLYVLGLIVLWLGVILLGCSFLTEKPSITTLFMLLIILIGCISLTALSIAFFRLSERLTTDED